MTAKAPEWGVLVDELRIFATASPGMNWWALYSLHQPEERLTCLVLTPQGGHWFVACDNRDDAEMVRDQIAGHGINPKLLKVTTLAACLKIKAARDARDAEHKAGRDAAAAEAGREEAAAWAWWVEQAPTRPGSPGVSAEARAEIGYPAPGFMEPVLRLYREHQAPRP